MKTIFVKCLVPAALLGMMLLPLAANAAPDHHWGVNGRLQNQNRRIEQGERSGQLTGREENRLERRDTRIQRQEHRMRLSGGQFTPRERYRLQRELNHSNRAIYRQKHDRQEH